MKVRRPRPPPPAALGLLDGKLVANLMLLGCVKKYVKPCFAAFTKLVVSLDVVFAGIAATVGSCVKAVLGASLGLSLGLGLDLGLGLGIGGIVGGGRA